MSNMDCAQNLEESQQNFGESECLHLAGSGIWSSSILFP